VLFVVDFEYETLATTWQKGYMMQTSLAETLRVLRARRGLTLVEASRQLGVNRHTLRELELGVRNPYYPTLEKIAQGYGLTVEELMLPTREEEPAGGALSSPKVEAATSSEPAEEMGEQRHARAPQEALPSSEEGRIRRVKLFLENIEHFTNQWQEEIKHPEQRGEMWAMGVQAMATGFQELTELAVVWRSKEEASEREWAAMQDLLRALIAMHDTAERVLKASSAEFYADKAANKRRAALEVIRGELSA